MVQLSLKLNNFNLDHIVHFLNQYVYQLYKKKKKKFVYPNCIKTKLGKVDVLDSR